MKTEKCTRCYNFYCEGCKDNLLDRTQQNAVCYLIGDWYLKWKDKFDGSHPLGRAKEDLKEILCKAEWSEPNS